MQALHFYCMYWKFYKVWVRSLFAEMIPFSYLFLIFVKGYLSVCAMLMIIDALPPLIFVRSNIAHVNVNVV